MEVPHKSGYRIVNYNPSQAHLLSTSAQTGPQVGGTLHRVNFVCSAGEFTQVLFHTQSIFLGGGRRSPPPYPPCPPRSVSCLWQYTERKLFSLKGPILKRNFTFLKFCKGRWNGTIGIIL